MKRNMKGATLLWVIRIPVMIVLFDAEILEHYIEECEGIQWKSDETECTVAGMV